MVNIPERINEHKKCVKEHYPENTMFFGALQGSQNYGLADEQSDIDTKFLLIPTQKDLIQGKKQISTTLIVAPTEEHADVKDIRAMFECFKKQDTNFLEILFTPFVIIDKNFEEYYHILWNKREEIAHYHPYALLRSMIGHLRQKYFAFDHPYPRAKEKLEKFGYDPKQLSHMIRIQEFLVRFFEKEESFEKCLFSEQASYLLGVKRGNLPLKEAIVLREETNKWAIDFLNTWERKVSYNPNEKVSEFLDEFTYEVLMYAYK